jgi:D-alanyl-D-alanine endopeptidase (penicillin-binding protein 7)
MIGRRSRWLLVALALTLAFTPLVDGLLGAAADAATRTTSGAAKKPPASKAGAKSTAGKSTAGKTTAKKTTGKATTKSAVKKPVAKKAAGKKTAVKSGKKSTKKAVSSRSRKAARRPAPVVAFDPARPATLRAESAVVLDRRTGHVLWGKNPDETRPVASLTKLMTALVVIESPLSMSDSITVNMDDVTGAGRSHVRAGNRVSIGDLFHCSLISSDNAATRALARATGMTHAQFVARMNQRARELGMEHSHYVETTGLDAGNVSTARDQARVLDAAYADPMVSALLRTETHSFRCGKRTETLNNTNRLLRSRSDIAGGKTGFTRPAGYCLATHIGDANNPNLTTVVLGAPSNASRFAESAKLIDWAKKSMAPVGHDAAPSHR